MNNYETLLEEACSSDVYVIENVPFHSNAKGLIRNDVIGLNQSLGTSTERACILAEELGHYYCNFGNIIDTDNISNAKQEHLARLWSYNKLIGLNGIIKAYQNYCSTRHEFADYLNVTEEFFDDAIKAYTDKYGVCTQIDNYIIFFTPNLGIMELI